MQRYDSTQRTPNCVLFYPRPASLDSLSAFICSISERQPGRGFRWKLQSSGGSEAIESLNKNNMFLKISANKRTLRRRTAQCRADTGQGSVEYRAAQDWCGAHIETQSVVLSGTVVMTVARQS